VLFRSYFVGDLDAPDALKKMVLNDLPFASDHPGGAHFGFADGHIDSFEDKNRDGKFGHTVEDGPDGPRLIYDDIEGKVFGGHIISGNRL